MPALQAAGTEEWARRLASIPYLCIRRNGQEIRGTSECHLGTEVASQSSPHDGIFAAWKWDGQRLVVRNDRYGFYPLFYCATNDGISVSPLVARLLAEGAPRELDDAAIAVFLRIGFFPGDATPFRAIRAVPPDASFTWSPEAGLTVSGRRAIQPRREMSREQALDGYIELFRQAMRSRPPQGRFVLPLSGGRDSRHILLEACAQGHPPQECVTVNLENANDRDVAAELCRHARVPHTVIERTPLTIGAEVRKNLETSFCSDEHVWSLNLADYLTGSAGVLYDGIAGDVLSASRYMSPERQQLFAAGRYADVAMLLVRDNDNLANTTLTPAFRRRWSLDIAVAAIEAELRLSEGAANPVPTFYFWNRTRREIALYTFGFLRGVPAIHAPFLDHALYDHLASLPVNLLLDRKLHDDAIRLAYPETAHIPYAAPHPEPASHHRALCRPGVSAIGLQIAHRNARFTRSSFFTAALTRACVQPRRWRQLSWLVPRLVYMLQLETACEEGVSLGSAKN